jgi:predicted nucleic acid-binding protein
MTWGSPSLRRRRPIVTRTVGPAINIGEVAYQLERRHGAEEAAVVAGRVRAAVALDDVTPERVLAAAHIKAEHPIAFADCFAAATALARTATLFTGDPELLDANIGCDMRDLRPSH